MSYRVHKSVSLITALAIVCGLGFTVPSTAHATELTLDDCIKLALANRASIIRARGDEELAKAGKRAALGAFLPRVSASYNNSTSKQFDQTTEDLDSSGNKITVDVPDQNGKNQSLSGRASMSLFDLSNFFNLAAASADRERARLDVIGSEQDLIYAVKLAYYQYLVSAQNINVQQEAVKRSEEQLKLIQSRFDLGSASLSDVLKQKVQVGSDRLELLRAQNSVTTTKADLAYTIGADPRQEWTFSAAVTPREYPGTQNEAIEYGLTHRPSVLSSEFSVKSARKSLSAASASYLPTLSGSASLSWGKGTFGFVELFESEGMSRSIGIGVDWTIFDGFQRERSITSAKVSRNNALAAQADLKNQTISNIKSVYSEIEVLKEQTKVANESVEAATEDLKITQEKYNLGAATILDLLESQVSLKRAQVQQLQVGFNLNLAVARLENATGKY